MRLAIGDHCQRIGQIEVRCHSRTCILPGMARQVWMVRAGRDSIFIDEFLFHQMIAIGWSKVGDLTHIHSREAQSAC
jgi:hypothetical protein